MKKRRAPELGALAREFELHNRSEGKSPRTVQWYNDVLDLFGGWLESEEMGTGLDELGAAEVRRFILHLQERPGLRGSASSHTVNNRVRALRAFFNWLYRQGYTETHRLEHVKPPKTRKKRIEILTDGEIERIFASINPDTVLGARNTAIFSLMLDTGLRLTEVVTLKHQDVHLDGRYVKVLGKGDKERLVSFGANCRKALSHYALHYRLENQGQEAEEFFLCIDGHPMGAEGLRSLTERLSKTAGVPRLHPHLFRHTYATRFLVNGGDALLLKQNLGHTTLAMVEKYIHLASQLAAVASQAFSPLDRVERPVTRRRNQRPRAAKDSGTRLRNDGIAQSAGTRQSIPSFSSGRSESVRRGRGSGRR